MDRLLRGLYNKLGELAQINNDSQVITVVPPTEENGFTKKYYIYNKPVTKDRTMTKVSWEVKVLEKKYSFYQYRYKVAGYRTDQVVDLTVNIEIYTLKNRKYNPEYLKKCLKLIDEIEDEISDVVRGYLRYYAASERDDDSVLNHSTTEWKLYPEYAKNIIGKILEKKDSGIIKETLVELYPDGVSLSRQLGRSDGCTMMGGSRTKRGQNTRNNKKRRGHKTQRRT